MSIATFEEILPELRELVKKNNFIRINALLRHSGYNTLCGEKLPDLSPREIGFLLERQAAENELNALKKEIILISAEPIVELSKTELNKLKKSELIDLLIGE